MKTIPWLLIAPMAAGCFSPEGGIVSVRPVTVRVVDAKTKKPLPDIRVAYALQTIVMRGRLLGLVPSLEPDIGPKLAFRALGRTDSKGEVSFALEEVRLPGNERVDEEVVLANVEADMNTRLSRTIIDTLQSACRAGIPTCAEPVDGVDVAWRAALSSKEDRTELFRNPNPGYQGVILIIVPGGAHAGRSDWTDPDDRFRVRTRFSLREGAEAVWLELEPYDQ